MTQKRLLVIGASGTIGTFVVGQLLGAGYAVRALARDGQRLRARLPNDVELASADLCCDPLAPLLADVDQVIYLVHAMADGAGYAGREAQAASRLATALKASSVRHLIYLGALSPPAPRSRHLQSRLATGQLLRASGVAVSELRAAVVIGPGSVPLELMRDVAGHLPLAPLPWGARHRSAPLALADLLAVISALIKTPEHWGLTADLAGPEILSYAQQLEAVAHSQGRRLRALPLPLLPGWLFGWLTPLFSTAPAPVIRALLGGLGSDLLARQPLPPELPQPTTPLTIALAALPQWQAQLPASTIPYPGNPCYRDSDRLAFYGLQLTASSHSCVSSAQLWAVASSLGGEQGYFWGDGLWTLRGWLDQLLGGIGNRRQRPAQLSVGARLDAWTVVALTEQPGHYQLLLRFAMKAPGLGHLQLQVSDQGDGSQLQLRAVWHPLGWKGLLYWWPLWPVHKLLFIGMSRAICRRAEQLAGAVNGQG
ncbi:MAG: DUF2867 domain-containing protein [Gammaproteobacteria bacterium]|nr:DUF2867 domain-containing protein [Gammaproteobacteria bacterium]